MKYIIAFVCLVILSATTLCDGSCSRYENGMSEQDKRTVVDKHNEYRRKLSEGSVPGQPRATYMKHITYDEQLAVTAQQLTDSCKFEHRQVQDGRWFAVGQNLYMSMSTGFDKGADWSSAIKEWYDEYSMYSYGGSINGENGHYTQLMWADTEYIGCGYTYFETNEFFKYRKLYACNYGPAGNIIGELPYET